MDIKGKKIAILATNGFEQAELEVPRDRLKKAGATVDVISLAAGEIKGWDKKDWGRSVKVDKTLDQVLPSDYDAVVLPGGQINPDLLRVEPKALKFIKDIFDAKKIVAAVCHAPWLLIETGIAKGRKMTSYKSIKTTSLMPAQSGKTRKSLLTRASSLPAIRGTSKPSAQRSSKKCAKDVTPSVAPLSYAVITGSNLMKKITLITLGLLLTTPAFAQSGDPAAGSASSPHMSNPSGSGTSTSGGRDYNDDQGRDRMGTTGNVGSQYNTEGTSSQPAQPNVTGQQKSGTNAEGRAKP